LTRRGLYQLVKRLGKRAGLQSARCSPHTFRHTFVAQFLREGGSTFTLKEMLGHTSLHMTNRYVALAQADIQNQHRQFSPGDRLKRVG
jgi:integrase/recombinase XerD